MSYVDVRNGRPLLLGAFHARPRGGRGLGSENAWDYLVAASRGVSVPVTTNPVAAAVVAPTPAVIPYQSQVTVQHGAVISALRYPNGNGEVRGTPWQTRIPVSLPPVTQVTQVPTTPTGGTQSTTTQVSGTPVPPGYSVNSIFIASDGSQWEYSTGQGKWISVGTPYNLNPTAPPAPATPNASTAAQVYGTPVPVGYLTTQAYTDPYGNVWQFNPSYGVWTETQLATTGSTAPLTNGTVAPAAAVTVDSTYSSILDWLTQQSLITGVPNWIIAAGLGFAALKVSQSGQGRR